MKLISNEQELAVIFILDKRFQPTRFYPKKVISGYYDENSLSFISAKGKSYCYALITQDENQEVFALRTTVGRLNSHYHQRTLPALTKMYLRDLKKYFYCYQASRIDYTDISFIRTDYLTEKVTELKDIDLKNILKVCNNVGFDTNKLISDLKEKIVGQDEAIGDIVSTIWQNVKGKQKNNILLIGPTGVGKTEIIRTIADKLNIPLVIANATNLTQTGYIGKSVEDILKELLIRCDNNIMKAEHSIIVIDEIDKLAGSSGNDRESVGTTAVQDELLKLLEDGTYTINISNDTAYQENIQIETKNITFIGIGAFSYLDEMRKYERKNSLGFNSKITPKVENTQITTKELTNYGLKPELIGRFSNIIELSPLTKENLIEIMINTKDNSLSQKINLLNEFGIDVEIKENVYDIIAKEAIEKKTGARGLNNVIETLFKKAMLEVSKNESEYEKLIIDEKTLENPKNYTLIKKKHN